MLATPFCGSPDGEERVYGKHHERREIGGEVEHTHLLS